jgi:hypothetical protein
MLPKINTDLGWSPSEPFGRLIENNWYLENSEWLKNVTSGDYQNYYSTNTNNTKELYYRRIQGRVCILLPRRNKTITPIYDTNR